MKILILSCGTGGGHNAAGQAVADELQRRGHTVAFHDTYQLVSQWFSSIINNTYNGMVRYTPRLFGAIYSLSEASGKIPGRSPVFWTNRLLSIKVAEFLQENRFDAVVMTHVFPAQMLASLKLRGLSVPPTYFVTTDYTSYPFVEEADCDHYIIPSDALYNAFIAKGIDPKKLFPLGIPVRQEFSAELTKATARQRLHLSPDASYLLLSGGSIGASCISDSISALFDYLFEDRNRHLIVICGNNQRLYQKLQRQYQGWSQLHLLRKTSRMADYMKACDLFITKPGGLSSTEAAVSTIPLIHLAPIPGCETHNVRFFTRRGMSLSVKKPGNELVDAVRKLTDPCVARKMQRAQAAYLNRNSTSDLCDLIERSHA